ncbi:response regulator [Paenibacillus athensensis]|nr:response regulator [Paenibacillus athensensis]MCD1259419.1 response regulator [Paenibacillus athensensis]
MNPTYSVVIVEDNPWIAKLLSEYSERCGLTVLQVVPCGEDIMSCYEQLNPDLMLVDIGLQGEMDGITTIQTLRDKGFHRQKIIMVSGTTNIEHILTSMNELGSLYFLSKPVLFPKFEAAIQKAVTEIELDRKRQEPGETATWITVKNLKVEVPILEQSIVFVEKEEKRSTLIYLVNGEIIEGNTSLSDILAQASPCLFSPYKGYLINLKHVMSYEKERGLPGSRRYLIHLQHTPNKIPLSRMVQKEFAQLLYEMSGKR